MALQHKLLGEFMGTFALVFAAVGSAAAGADLLGQAMANGLVLSVAVAAYGGISNAHFNPAVTIGFAIAGRCPWREVVPYIAVQLAAAIGASYAVMMFYEPAFGAVIAQGAALPAEQTPVGVLLVGEALITCLLMIAIYGTMIDRRGCDGGGGTAKIGGFGVGFAVAANILALGPVTGASMNPARSLGPALMLGEPSVWQLHWCYWVGPTIGAIIGALIYEQLMLRGVNDEPSEEG